MFSFIKKNTIDLDLQYTTTFRYILTYDAVKIININQIGIKYYETLI